ncbi:Ca-activated chloride channel family protein [Wenyingzhuangia heitensis]|uniref:Ca-activated chloride channel family protein n=1 Tax=Wenyingzhuangia heitensis TaxID=1487859 RepID=A0ABX0U9T1_9FLAO|nr:VWA domain-containing protein [Wenyingzhuangia heitensis]NIJ43832.1 Ca-activated chloride channel family protein [Wenyingzhuangia heitensis]
MKYSNFEFTNPLFLWGLIIIPLLAAWLYVSRNRNQAKLSVSSVKSIQKSGLYTYLYRGLWAFRLLALTLLIVALARPRNVAVTTKNKKNKGIDIVMATDVSGSMLAKDLKPNRLEALKDVAEKFVDKRPNDRIGVVLYAGESYTKTPITSDKSIVKRTIASIEYGGIEDGTAIGMGLGAAVNRLKDSKAKSKVIILLTDGVNTAGSVDPKLATELAKGVGVKVYTIGIGTNGMAEMPYAKDYQGRLLYKPMQVEIDEKLLTYIAEETGGKYFRATSNTKLKTIYDEIDKLEKTEIEEFKYYNYQELYRNLVLAALALLALEYLLKNTLFKSFI